MKYILTLALSLYSSFLFANDGYINQIVVPVVRQEPVQVTQVVQCQTQWYTVTVPLQVVLPVNQPVYHLYYWPYPYVPTYIVYQDRPRLFGR